MKKLTIKLTLFLLTIIFIGCKKFLEVEPKGIIIPENTKEFEGILNSPVLAQTFPPELLRFTDDLTIPLLNPNIAGELTNAYFWQEYITPEGESKPAIWGASYNAIYHTNVIINNIMESAGGTTEKKQQVLAEAMLLRAYIYHELITVFAKAYNPATAATDPGLPLVTSIDVTDNAPPRSTVKECFDYMINDINNAVAHLPADNINRYRATKYCGYGLLSRLYLYMSDYENAKLYANKALEAPHSYLDYNKFPGSAATDGFPVPDNNPQILWQKSSTDSKIPFQDLYSQDFMSYFDTAAPRRNPDLRYRFFTIGLAGGLGRIPGAGSYANFGITFPELDLTLAEIFARSGDISSALKLVNQLRKNRIVTTAYTDFTAGTAEEALKIVLAERRRELAFGGLRWFDMKRLDLEGKMPTVYRKSLATPTTPAAIVDSLPPHSPGYTFQIPLRVQKFNPDMEKNTQ